MEGKEEKGNGYLCSLLAKDDTSEFERDLAEFLDSRGNINDVGVEGRTILDECDFIYCGRPDYTHRRNLIINAGGKLGAEVSDIARQKAAEPIIPGQESSSISMAPTECFNYENKELKAVSEYLASTEVQDPNQIGVVDVRAKLNKVKPAIGRLFDAGSFVSTLFLIKDDWVITARHSVNYSKPENLTVYFGDDDFDEDTAVTIAGAIESGETSELDYVILKLSKPITDRVPLDLSSDNNPTSLLFVGYDESGVLHFSATSYSHEGEFDQLKIVGYQGTGACFSGSPYINLDGIVCGLHSSASLDQKNGIHIKMIIEANIFAPLDRLIENEDVSHVSLLPVTFFSEFTSSTAMFEFDERGPLKMTVEFTPSAKFQASGASNNQSNVRPKKKIAERLRRLQSDGKLLTDVQKRYLALGGNYATNNANIQIAHNIAISAMTTALVNKMNNPIPPADNAAEIKAAKAFADAIASSDDEDPNVARRAEIKKKLPNLVRKIRNKQNQAGGITKPDADSLIADAKVVLTLLNGRSKNLMPGHAEVNEHLVRSNRDPHLTQTATGYDETTTSALLSITADAFFVTPHNPLTKPDGSVASSSVNSGNVKGNAYYKP